MLQTCISLYMVLVPIVWLLAWPSTCHNKPLASINNRTQAPQLQCSGEVHPVQASQDDTLTTSARTLTIKTRAAGGPASASPGSHIDATPASPAAWAPAASSPRGAADSHNSTPRTPDTPTFPPFGSTASPDDARFAVELEAHFLQDLERSRAARSAAEGAAFSIDDIMNNPALSQARPCALSRAMHRAPTGCLCMRGTHHDGSGTSQAQS
jgi:hypothetical protein